MTKRTFAIVLIALCGWQAFMSAQSKQLIAQTYYNTFSRAHAPLARIRPGDAVATRTIDASGRDHTGSVVGRPPNPLTGPSTWKAPSRATLWLCASPR